MLDVRNEVVIVGHAARETKMAEVRESVEDLIRWVVGDATGQPLHRLDAELHVRVMALGLSLVALWLAYRVPVEISRTFQWKHGWYLHAGKWRGRAVVSRFGSHWWIRPIYELQHGEGPPTVAPVDGDIGLAAGGMSLTVHLLAANMAARMSYEEAKEVTEAFGDYAPSTRSMQGIVEKLGPQGAHHMANLPAPEDDGDILVVEGDGKGVPHVGDQEHARRCKPHRKRSRGLSDRRERKKHRRLLRKDRVRKKVGDKSKNARMFTAFVVYTVREHADGSVEGPINRRVFATFDGPKKAAKLALADAKKRGYGTKETLFLADGAPHLWKIWRRSFAKARPCLDWYHLSEYLWAAGTALHGAKSRERRPWVTARLDELMRGDVGAVIDALVAARQALADAPKKRRKNVKKAIKYVRNHETMMRAYGELNDRNITYGTGVIEGTIKGLGSRLDAAGSRWCREGSDAMLPLCCVLLSDEWAAFEERVRCTHEAVNSPVIPRVTRPGPRTPHKSASKAT
ncbi:MAG: UPF0236 family transposase-like protein [Pseudonocardiaceae bacterium]